MKDLSHKLSARQGRPLRERGLVGQVLAPRARPMRRDFHFLLLSVMTFCTGTSVVKMGS